MKIHHSYEHAVKRSTLCNSIYYNVSLCSSGLNGLGWICYLTDHNKLFFNEWTDRVNGSSRLDYFFKMNLEKVYFRFKMNLERTKAWRTSQV